MGDLFRQGESSWSRLCEFDAVAMLGGDQPQRSYPLRNVAEINFKVVQGNNASSLGEATFPQALRECYPGATYFYTAVAPYKVEAWRTTGFEPSIRVKASFRGGITRPRIRTWINATLGRHGVVDQHFRKNTDGYLADCDMQITEKVEGYEEGGEFRSYVELREQNPNMRPKPRQFRTTGVLLCVRTPWFRTKGMKAQLADSLLDMFCREYSVPQDVGSASTNISVRSPDADIQRTDCVAIFDQTYGSLPLTERLYLDFASLLTRMLSGTRIEAGDKQSLWIEFLERLIEVEPTLETEESEILAAVDAGEPYDGEIRRVYAPGSKVGLREKGMLLVEVELMMPAILPDGTSCTRQGFFLSISRIRP